MHGDILLFKLRGEGVGVGFGGNSSALPVVALVKVF